MGEPITIYNEDGKRVVYGPFQAERLVQEGGYSYKPIEPPSMSNSDLTDIPELGPARAEKLKAEGIKSLEDLAAANASFVASVTSVSPEMAVDWIGHAAESIT